MLQARFPGGSEPAKAGAKGFASSVPSGALRLGACGPSIGETTAPSGKQSEAGNLGFRESAHGACGRQTVVEPREKMAVAVDTVAPRNSPHPGQNTQPSSKVRKPEGRGT